MIASSPSGANINESAFDGFTQEQGVAVVGSSNVDLTYGVKRIPKVGETLFADSFDQQFGGKGANQAVCISKLSSKEAKVVFVTVVGNDAFGNQVKENFRANNLYNVDKNIRTVDSVSGQALIFVEKETGNNSIVLVGGSNEHLAPQMVDDSWDDIKQCKVLVCQNETPLNATYHALKRGKEEGMITIFNPAPAVNLLNLPTEIADLPKYVDYLIPNETEAPLIIGKEMSDAYVEDQSSVESLCREIKEKLSVSNVIITLGKRGCAALYNENEQLIYTYVEGEVVDAVDSTGAGDAWVGSFSYFISCDIPVEESIKLANFIASITVQYKGAQMSYNSISQSTILKKFEL